MTLAVAHVRLGEVSITSALWFNCTDAISGLAAGPEKLNFSLKLHEHHILQFLFLIKKGSLLDLVLGVTVESI